MMLLLTLLKRTVCLDGVLLFAFEVVSFEDIGT